MPVIEFDEAYGAIDKGEVVCSDCIEKDSTFWDNFDKKQGELLMEEEIDSNERIYKCNRCGKTIVRE